MIAAIEDTSKILTRSPLLFAATSVFDPFVCFSAFENAMHLLYSIAKDTDVPSRL